jgi:HEAT repeat protein
MAEPARLQPLAPDAAARLAEFARACKAAARAVSLYPGGHPAIGTTLGRLAQVTTQLTEAGPYRFQVTADTLIVGGAVPVKPESAIAELADLLHRQLIGGVTLNAGAETESWRTLLLLLARAPEEVRTDGGIKHLWATAGGPSIEIEEIDYAEVLREKQGVAATAEQIMAAALAGRPLELDDSGMRLLLDIVQDPSRLAELMSQIEEQSAQHGADAQAAAFLTLLKGLTEYLSKTNPHKLEPIFGNMGRAAGHLSAEAMLKLLDLRNRPEAMVGSVDVTRAVIDRMDDHALSHFVAGSIIKERGATERLAHAFQALAPDGERQRQLLGLAKEEVAAEGGGEGLEALWKRVEGMLTSYSDEQYVSEQYGRELSNARTRPVEVEAISDDPPERIGQWLGTVGDASLRSLDHQLLLDLLAIEADPPRWRDIAETATGHAEDLVRVGYFDQAWQLADAVVREGQRIPARGPHATAALERFGRGTMMRHVSTHLRGSDDEAYERFKVLCHAIGPAVIPALAEGLSSEKDARARRRLRDILVGFGPKGRESVQRLMSAPNWEVRRTAAYLLREFGGAEGLKDLIPLLSDSEPLVQREAVQGLVMNGSEEASRLLMQAITSATGRSRETLLKELTSIRDERVGPVFTYLVKHMDRRKEAELYMTAVVALGSFGRADAVGALKFALHEGDIWSPMATRRLRAAAAQALRRLGTPAALDVLREASEQGSRGVRSAARSELERTS